MATGLGYLSKAAFRLNKPDLTVDLCAATNGARDTAYPTTTTIATTGAQRMGPYDMIPLLSEDLTEKYEFKDIRTLTGQSGLVGRDTMFKDIGGTLTLEAWYIGLDNIFAAALGYEKPSFDDSPNYLESESGDNPMTGVTTAGSAGTTLQDTTLSQFVTDNIGEWVRIADSGDATEGQVRRITARTDADNVTINAAWTADPGAGKDYQIARAFRHTYECSVNMHVEDIDDVYTNYDTETSGSTTDHLLRFGTLCFEKTVGIWEYRAVMINSLTIRHSVKDGVTLEAEVVPFDLLLSSAVNTASTTWAYSATPTTPIHLEERIMPGDLSYFRLDDFSDSVSLTSADNQPISEWSLTINNNLQVDAQDAVSGLYRAEPVRNGFREITGTFTVPRYAADTFITKYQSDTTLMGWISYTGSSLTGDNISNTHLLIFELRSLKLTSHSEPIPGPDVLTQTFNFKAVSPTAAPSGMTVPNNTNSEIVIRTYNNNPFNAFRAQNGE